VRIFWRGNALRRNDMPLFRKKKKINKKKKIMSDEATELIIETSQETAKKFPTPELMPHHVVIALTETSGCEGNKLLSDLNVDRNQLVETLSEELYSLQSEPHEGTLLPSEELQGILPTASSYSRSAGAPVITTAHLVYGLYQEFPLFRNFLAAREIAEADIKNRIESIPRTEV
jgi:ATP-dependent Clp protease ATP-binding subunit ClpA